MGRGAGPCARAHTFGFGSHAGLLWGGESRKKATRVRENPSRGCCATCTDETARWRMKSDGFGAQVDAARWTGRCIATGPVMLDPDREPQRCGRVVDVVRVCLCWCNNVCPPPACRQTGQAATSAAATVGATNNTLKALAEQGKIIDYAALKCGRRKNKLIYSQNAAYNSSFMKSSLRMSVSRHVW